VLHVSPDGIHWTEEGRSGLTGDRTTFFYNPFRERWVFSMRNDDGPGRYRQYLEAKDFLAGARWQKNQAVPWTSADAADPRRPDYNVAPELYNLDCVAYESLMLGLFTIFRGERTDREKPNEVCVGFSRDGFHWSRPDRRAFLPVSAQIGDWNWANVQSAGGGCLVVGDKLYFYVSGRRGYPGTSSPGTCSTGLAMLRRDGFASMDHPTPRDAVERVLPTPGAGVLVTRPVRFSGRHLFVNINAPAGDLRVEVLDREGQVLPGYELARSVAVGGNSTRARVTWQGDRDLSAIAGRTVRFRFHLRRGSLYAFWVSASLNGASQGYVAAGGPGYTGLKDTTGAVPLGTSPPQM
jgi:hypothetical protein